MALAFLLWDLGLMDIINGFDYEGKGDNIIIFQLVHTIFNKWNTWETIAIVFQFIHVLQ